MKKEMNNMNTEEMLPSVLNINNDQLSFSPAFQRTLDEINIAVNHAEHLVSLKQVDTLDEDSMETIISDLQSAQKLARNITHTRTDLRKYLKNRENIILSQFDKALNDSRFNELSNYNEKAKQFKRDLSQYRINKRWEEIKPFFDSQMNQYENISRLAPALKDFDMFKLRNPKLVNGAKKYVFGTSQKEIIHEYAYDVYESLNDLEKNELHLAPKYQNEILQNFIKKPTRANYFEIKNQVMAQAKQDEINLQKERELKKQAEEIAKQKAQLAEQAKKARLEALQKQEAANRELDANKKQALEQEVQKQNERFQVRKKKLDSTTQQILDAQAQAKALKEEAMQTRNKGRQWLSNYVMINRRKYGNLVNDSSQKVLLIYDLVHALDDPNSDFAQFIKSEIDPKKSDQLFISVISQVANV